MFIAALAIIAAAPLDAFDDANLALTQCSFAIVRESHAADRTDAEFQRLLASRCSAQTAALRREMVSIETRRGGSPARAAANADRLIARVRADFAAQYARRKEDEAKLRALERALREERNQ